MDNWNFSGLDVFSLYDLKTEYGLMKLLPLTAYLTSGKLRRNILGKKIKTREILANQDDF